MKVKITGSMELEDVLVEVSTALGVFKTYGIKKARGINLYLNLLDEDGNEIDELVDADGVAFSAISIKSKPKQKAKETQVEGNVIQFPGEPSTVKKSMQTKEEGKPLKIPPSLLEKATN